MKNLVTEEQNLNMSTVEVKTYSLNSSLCFLSTDTYGPNISVNKEQAKGIIRLLTDRFYLNKRPTKRVLMVKESSSDLMTDKINFLLKDGWELKGNPFMSHGYWCQLMEKTDT